MLQVARLAPNLLGDASSAVAEFLLAGFNDDGGAADRSGRSDLYYTVFALEGLVALQREIPPHVRGFLERFNGGRDLDLVHLCCLARCWATLIRKRVERTVLSPTPVRTWITWNQSSSCAVDTRV